MQLIWRSLSPREKSACPHRGFLGLDRPQESAIRVLQAAHVGPHGSYVGRSGVP